MQNILVVNMNWLGDVIFSAPIFKALKEKYPQSKVSCLAVPRVKEILECMEGVDEIIIYEEEGRHKSIWGKLSLIEQLRRQKFDAAFLLHRSLTRALLVYGAGIKQRIGYNTKGRKKFLTHALTEPKEQLHRSDYYLKVIEDCGVTVSDRRCVLKVDALAKSKVDGIRKKEGLDDRNLIVIHPSGNWDLKRWPVRSFSLLIQRIMEEGKWKVAVTGSSDDQELVNTIVKDLPVKPVILTGQLSLKELMAFMQKTALVISGDSGPIHLASGVGSRVIGLFGPTRPELTGPRGSGEIQILQQDVGCNRQACYHLKCPSNLCMQAITIEDVLDVVRKI